MMNRLCSTTLLFLAALLAACTAEQGYNTGQAWQRNQCATIADRAEYDRCVRNVDMSYESYRRETGGVQK